MSPQPEDTSKQARRMQENMIKMHEQMHKIIDAKDPAEREMGPGAMGGGPKPGAGD